MRYIVIILWIACLGACNPDVKQKVTVNGKLTNYKGKKYILRFPAGIL